MNNYEPLEAVGSGSFGLIRKVRRLIDGKILARKEIDYRKMSEKEKKQLVAEVNILRELRHPNILIIEPVMIVMDSSYLLIEYCEGGDLAAVIKRCKKEGRLIPEEIVWNLLGHLLLALQECHDSDNHPTILHRDIKPDNDKLLNVKLGDFGLSRVIENPEVEFASTYVGTPFYMSPELVDESRYNAKSDIWALGCLIYELCALEPPFQASTQIALATKIKSGKLSPLSTMYSSELQRVIRIMLTLNHEHRPTTRELLNHDHIKLSIREQSLSNSLADLNIREEELSARLREIDDRERLVAIREANLGPFVDEAKTVRAYRNSSMIDTMCERENEHPSLRPSTKVPNIVSRTNVAGSGSKDTVTYHQMAIPSARNVDKSVSITQKTTPNATIRKTRGYQDTINHSRAAVSSVRHNNMHTYTSYDDRQVPVMAEYHPMVNVDLKPNTVATALHTPAASRMKTRIAYLRIRDPPAT
ncbi:hypothetical protein BSLG_004911 [Batrachochytrium salamandrivorans]|nr:hypothetical protein BSLG_004911 [Batrachochytrium salamandrivorans]